MLIFMAYTLKGSKNILLPPPPPGIIASIELENKIE